MVTEYEGEILRVQNDEVTFKLDRSFDMQEARRLSLTGIPKTRILIVDERDMTLAQNGMLHGLFHDMAEYTGYPPEYTKSLLKLMFASSKGLESFSMENYGISQVFAGEFIEYVLTMFLEEGIPFKYQKFHLNSDITRVLFLFLKHRQCYVCGKSNADVEHADPVGMGRDRKTIDHSNHRFMALCREHHSERHQIGLLTFMDKYHLIPIKLTPEQVKEFKIGV